MNLLKLFWSNLKDKPTTAAAVCSIAAWALNRNAQLIPPDVANSILVFVNAAALALFAKTGTSK